jgi:pyridoxine 5-phosphate synthase
MRATGLKLGVNVDHVATLRQARGTPYPGVVEAALACERAGARGITVHLREDRRHIQDADVYALRKSLKALLNLEMAVAPQIVRIALDVKPDEVCLVPERREELTTEGGLDVAGQLKTVAPAVARLRAAGIGVSLFVEADSAQIRAARRTGADTVELHTGTFCDAPRRGRRAELERLKRAAREAHRAGLRVNAGHGISLDTIGDILRVPHLDTLNIGHSIVSRAVFCGIEQAVREMLDRMAAYAGGEP